MASLGIKPRLALLLLSLLCLFRLTAFDGEQRFRDIAEGDLLFTLPHRPNDITIATAAGDIAADHVAICHRIGSDNGPLYLIEAVGKGVTLTPIDTLLARHADDTILIGRVDNLDTTVTIARALSLLNRPYDYLYLPDNDDIYCSELVQLTYRHTDGTPVFETIPMSFHDASGSVTQNWRDYYRRRGTEVPEGAPGTNPTQLATHHAVTLSPLCTP